MTLIKIILSSFTLSLVAITTTTYIKDENVKTYEESFRYAYIYETSIIFSWRKLTFTILYRNLRLLQNDQCADIEPEEDFDLDAYISAPWFVQKQRVTSYLPVEQFYCTEARYSTNLNFFWILNGWEVAVNNYSEDADGNGTGGGGLCAAGISNSFESKLGVSLCFLFPASFWARRGPYWVMAFDDEAGWAVITGGKANIWTGSGCKTRNGKGTWIFTREQTGEGAANAASLALEAARAKGLDVDNLTDFFDVDHTSCNREN